MPTTPNPADPEIGKRFAATLARARGVLVITGAGISVESGMPTYRGPGGLYEEDEEIPDLLSAEGLARHPERLWRHLDEMRVKAAAAEPNAAHRILAQWEREKRFERFLIATQNVDGLHQRAGSDRVAELHGSLWQMARPRAVEYADDEAFSQDAQDMMGAKNRDSILRRWSEENHQIIWEDRTVPFTSIPPYDDPEIRPNIVFFNESYGNRLLWVDHFIRQAPDVVLIIGCSGGVTLLDRLLRSCRQANPACAIFNLNPHEDAVRVPHEYWAVGAGEGLVGLGWSRAFGGGAFIELV